MGFKLKDGVLVDDKGEPIKVGDQVVKLDGVFDQAAVDAAVKERLAREGDKHRKALEELKTGYEEKLKGATTPEEIAELNAKIEQLNQSLMTKDEQAAVKVKQLKDQHQQELGLYEKKANENLQLFRSERLNNAILNNAARTNFLDPMDAVTQLAPLAVWEEETNEAGKKTGNWNLSFKMSVKEKDSDKVVEKLMPAEQAVAALAATKPYMIRGTNTSGWGGGQQSVYNPAAGTQDWRTGTPEQKIAAGYGKE